MILAGDIGGTKVHLALYSFAGGRLKVRRTGPGAALPSRLWPLREREAGPGLGPAV